MHQADAPVGIIDSGIGGLSFAKAFKELLPQESFVFFGDTAHLPYGDKSAQAIKSYTRHLLTFLLREYKCKAVVVACNTASAIAGRHLINHNKTASAPVLNVIDPVVDHVVNRLNAGKIGVIGTRRTIASRAYPYRIRKLQSSAKVFSRSTPLLAPMIEEGFFNNNISQTIINTYLSWSSFKDIDALILGCTHYPHISEEVRTFLGPDVEVIEGADIVVQALKTTLIKNGLTRVQDRHGKPDYTFLVSDFTTSFQKTTEIFFGEKVKLEAVKVWEEKNYATLR